MNKREVEKFSEREQGLTRAMFGGDEYEKVQDGAGEETEPFG